jgi:hypothetical protein
MTRVGWLVDHSTEIGGAELTQAEFRAGASAGVEIVDCPPGGVDPGCDVYVIHNCVTYQPDDMAQIDGRAIKYWHDVGPHVVPGVRQWLDKRAEYLCCSPVQAESMGLDDAALIPPPVDLARFERAAAEVNGSRSGQVCVGSWRNYGKAPQKVAEWAKTNGPVDFFGGGPWAPHGSQEVPYEAMPALLAQYERFVFLPLVLEPFGRLVAEAWAAGCEIVTNGLVGSRWWIENEPDKIETATQDFWGLVLQ